MKVTVLIHTVMKITLRHFGQNSMIANEATLNQRLNDVKVTIMYDLQQ